MVYHMLNEKTKLKDMRNIGDYIKARYTAKNSWKPGYIWEIGTTTAIEIPTTPTATTDGSFYLIHSGWDIDGRMKLIPDRNLQGSLSYDSLNYEGLVYGVETNLFPLIGIHTSNISLTGTASASSIFGVTYDAWKAFDKINNTEGWITASGIKTGWLCYEFITPKVVVGYSLKAPSYNHTQMPKDWIIEGLNGSNWEVLDRKSGVAFVQDEIKFYNFPNKKSYSKYRINITANNGLTNYCGIQEFQLYDEESLEYSITSRLLSGGVSGADKDNEWDKIIAESTLNGKIPPGDNNIWHYSTIYSWTSTTSPINSNRIIRGTTTATTRNETSASSSNGASFGYRPMLLIESLIANKYLIKKDDHYYSVGSTDNYDDVSHTFIPLTLEGGNTPNKNDIDKLGFDNLNLLINTMTKGSDSFKPIEKLNPFELKTYQPN